jgi:DNA gyrase subunit A
MEAEAVQRVDIEQKMRGAYLSYAMSVITARALPDVRDGLKPVQRRILYAMGDMGLRHDLPPRKCARIVGEVLGKYHPHSDSSVYEALVHLAQDFSMRYVLVDGQGNFGSVDGDDAAAMRYTEARLSALGEEMLLDLDKETVDFVDNFDGSVQEPTVLPAKVPNLLINGASGIAVGMATNIPPHNLCEIADACVYMIDHYNEAEDVSVDDLMQFIQGPDFPTGGTIMGREEIRQAYATGKGHLTVRAQAHIEDLRGGHSAIIVTELPFQVNKATLVERIAELVRNGRIEGIGDLRDESDLTGMRVVVELKRGVDAAPLLSQLLKLTQMQTTFGVNMLALVDGEPRVLPLKRILVDYLEHRQEVITRRTHYELEKAQARAHILEGLLLALDHLDEVIQTIRHSRTAETAQQNLCTKFKLTEVQARAILDMQLRRLAALERHKIEEEYAEVRKRIEYLRGLLKSKGEILELIKADVLELKRLYGDARRTRISEVTESSEFRPEDLVPNEDVVILLTRSGSVRRLPVEAYLTRAGGSRTSLGLPFQGGDAPQAVLKVNSRETIVCFTDRGRALQTPAHQVPDGIQQPMGLPLRQIVPLSPEERVVALTRIDPSEGERYVTMATRQGKVKRLALSELASLGNAGAQVIGLADGDALASVVVTGGSDELIAVSEQGKAIRFQEDTVRPQGRTGMGVRGITLGDGDALVAMDVVRDKGELVLATALGFAKRTPVREYSVQGRGGMGVLTMDVDRLSLCGPVVAAQVALPEEQLLLASAKGTMLRARVTDVPALERTSWGRVVTRTRRGAMLPLDGDALVLLLRLEPGLAPAVHEGSARGQRGGAGPQRGTSVREAASPGRARTEQTAAPERQKPKATPAPTRPAGDQKELPTKRARRPEDQPAKPSRARPEPATKPPAKETPAAVKSQPGKPTQARRTGRATVTKVPQRGRRGKAG